jgi:hypothetical protein
MNFLTLLAYHERRKICIKIEMDSKYFWFAIKIFLYVFDILEKFN